METIRPSDAPPAGLGQLCTVMAHDVRGPANILNITADLLETAIERACAGEIDAARLRRLVGAVKVQSRRLSHRLDAILQSYCGPESANAASVFDLRPVVAEGLRQVASRATAGGHNFSFDGAPDPVPVRGHPAVIRQAVVEIVENAVESSPEGGRVTARVAAEQDIASVTIEDAGIGIPQTAIERIFDRDFTTKEPGRGFGLHFVKEAVNAHEGRVAADDPDPVVRCACTSPFTGNER